MNVNQSSASEMKTNNRIEPEHEHKPELLMINPVTNFTNLMSHVTTLPLAQQEVGRGWSGLGINY